MPSEPLFNDRNEFGYRSPCSEDLDLLTPLSPSFHPLNHQRNGFADKIDFGELVIVSEGPVQIHPYPSGHSCFSETEDSEGRKSLVGLKEARRGPGWLDLGRVDKEGVQPG